MTTAEYLAAVETMRADSSAATSPVGNDGVLTPEGFAQIEARRVSLTQFAEAYFASELPGFAEVEVQLKAASDRPEWTLYLLECGQPLPGTECGDGSAIIAFKESPARVLEILDHERDRMRIWRRWGDRWPLPEELPGHGHIVALYLSDAQTSLIANNVSAEAQQDRIYGLIAASITSLLTAVSNEVIPCDIEIDIKPNTALTALQTAAAALRSAGYTVLTPVD